MQVLSHIPVRYSFDDFVTLREDDVTRIDTKDAMYLRKGDVVLVESDNVPELGKHYIVVTGHPVQKPHGIRPQTASFCAKENSLLPKFEKKMGVTALKLSAEKAAEFRRLMNIRIEGDKVVMRMKAIAD